MRDVLSTLAPRAQGGASFDKRLTSQAENVSGSVCVPIMNRAAMTAPPSLISRPLFYLGPPNAFAVEAGLSA
jgi:hypothetical protein